MDRLFVAVPLAEQVRSALQDYLRREIPEGLPGRVVVPDNWHLTLRFLGDTTREAATAMIDELRSAKLGQPFHVQFDHCGAFPRPRRASVLWVGISEGASELAALAALAEDAARRVGFPAERRPFTAHLTLSRLRPPEELTPLLQRLAPAVPPMEVQELVLFRSRLGAGPARYEVVERFPLE